MTPERWRRVEGLLRSALERPEPERAGMLDAACAGDPGLRAEVEALLAADAAADDLIAATIAAGARLLAEAGEPGPRRAGPYRLERELGRGATSTVYLARRADRPDGPPVAVKIVRPGLDGEELLRRFATERRILAGFEHPHIARLLDAGTAADGRPYFVLEHVEGLPIHDACDARGLTTAERVRLFRDVCAAVHYAHQNLVVHRDLKPSNVLVTAEGVPKLLDFGIAKLLTESALERTATALRPMTPAYASPEQVRGGAITTASDVYSLGVLLWELLAGCRPYRLDGLAPQEVERTICEAEPELPPGCRLDGDLETILRMALRKEPGRRYGSADQLSADLGRYLAGRPVLARPDTFGYRSAKFVRRHRWAVAAAAGFAALLVAFAGATALQSARTARERDRAERVSALLVDLFAVADPGEARGNTITAREILDRGAAKVGRELGDEPELRAKLLATIGEVYRKLGLYRSAAPLLEQALALRRRVLPREDPEVARTLNSLGVVRALQGDYAGAEPLFREALAMRRKVLGDDHPEVGASLNNLALLLHDRGDYAAAEPLYREALKRDPGETEHAATAIANLALLLYDEGKYAAAESLYREALAIDRWVFGERHPDFASHLGYLALTLQARGDHAAAEPLFRRALALHAALQPGEHLDLARDLHNLGAFLAERGEPARGEPLLVRALAIRGRLLPDDHPEVAASREALARVRRARGDAASAADAERLLRRALAGYRASLPAGHPSIAGALAGLGALLGESGDWTAAEPLLREALAIQRRRLAAGDRRTAETARLLDTCLVRLGRPVEDPAAMVPIRVAGPSR